MITETIRIIDRIIALLKLEDARRVRTFDKLVEPTFGELLAIHKNYTEMLDQVIAKLDDADRGFRYDTPQNATYMERQAAERQKLAEAIQYLRDSRKELFELRTKVITLVNLALADGAQDKLFREFFIAIVEYFQPIDVHFSDPALRPKRRFVSREGESPMSKTIMSFEDILDGVECSLTSACRVSDKMRVQMNTSWSRVCYCYSALRIRNAKSP
jgi:hypothetical protein